MGQDPRADGTAVAEPQDPERLRRQIEVTRRELGDTVAAAVASVAEKADVKAQARHKVQETKATLHERREDLLGRAKEASPEEAVNSASRAVTKARAHPLPLVVLAALIAGFLAGRLTNRTD
jgi:hypothetical protein